MTAASTENDTFSPLLDTIDILNQTNTTTKEIFIARTDGMLLSYSFLLLAALLCVYFGSYRSVTRKNKQKKSGEKPDILTAKDAAMFPFIASGFLFGIYLVILLVSKEYISFVLNIYFFLIGIVALYRAIEPVFAKIRLPLLNKLRERQFHINLTENKPSDTTENESGLMRIDFKFDLIDVGVLFLCVLVGVWYLLKRHWIANNIFGIAFSINAIEILHFNKVLNGVVLLSGLFVYDIFWVFGTNVMVTVAKSFDAPIKLLFPQDLIENGLFAANKFAMLGLGDIVIPGAFIALLLRYDMSRRQTGRKSVALYFTVSFIAYNMGTSLSTRNLIQYTQSLFTFICGSICLFLLSILTYVTLRKHLIPISHLIIPISLGFPPLLNSKPDFNFLKPPTNIPSYLVSYVNLSDTMYDRYPLDISSHIYRIELSCDSPRSYRNRQLGSFYVQLILYSTSNEIIIEHSRVILFPYQSDIIRLVRTIIFLPLSIFRIGYDRWHLKEILIDRLTNHEKSKRFVEIIQLNIVPSSFQIDRCSIHFNIRDLTGLAYFFIINVNMYEHKCKGCLIDSTHGKLQKKKDALLEFIFADNSLCLTVSAQNVNIITYTLSKDTMSSAVSNVLNSELLFINLIGKKQLKISAIGRNKVLELKAILDCLINKDLDAYQRHVENFCANSISSNNTSKNEASRINLSRSSTHNNSSLLSDTASRKQPKMDKMKHTNKCLENDENFQPMTSNTSKTIEKKRNALYSASNFYAHPQHHDDENDPHSIDDENIDHSTQIQSQSRKRSTETIPSMRFQHATNTTSPYFFQRADNKLKRHISNGESRMSLLSNIHSKPLHSNARLWNDDDDKNDLLWEGHDSAYSTKYLDNSTLIDLSLSKSATSSINLRKKGLKNIGATCYMNSILQCLLNIDPFRYDLMVTNSELITSSLLDENTIYLCVLKILALLQDRQSTQSQHSTTTQITDDERTVESQALINLKKAVEKHSGNFLGSRQQVS
ncbi:unnamed protein product [Rotaria socialis]